MKDILKSSRLCKEMSEEQIDRLIALGKPKYMKYNKNDILFLDTLDIQSTKIMVSGSIAIAKDMPDGKRILGNEINTSGELIGDVNLFATMPTFWTYFVAMTDSIVLHISLQPFLQKCSEYTDIQIVLYRNLLATISDKLVYANDKLAIYSLATVRKKIVYYLLGQAKENEKVHLKITREELADYLGIQRPSLSRELGKMQREGLITVHYRTIQILKNELFDILND